MLVPDLLNSGLAPCLSPGSGLRDLLTTRLHASSPASSAIITPLPHLLYSSILPCSHLYHTYFVQLLILILLLSLPSVFVIFNSPRCFHLVYFKINRGRGNKAWHSFMIRSIFPDSVFGGCCVSGPYIHDLINPYYPDIGSLPYEEYDCVVSFL